MSKSKVSPYMVFADQTRIFATHKFIAIIADAIEQNVKAGQFSPEFKVGVEGDTIVKFYSNHFTVTCTRIIDDTGIYAVEVACSRSMREQFKDLHTLEFIHHKLSTYFGTSAAQPDPEHNVHDMLKAAELVTGRTIVTENYGEPIGLLFADANDRHTALRRLQMVEAEFKDDVLVYAGQGFLNLLKVALDHTTLEGVTIRESEAGHVVISWDTGEVHFVKDEPGVYVLNYYTMSELASMTRTQGRFEFIHTTVHNLLLNLQPDSTAYSDLLKAIRQLGLAVPTDPDSITEPFFLLYSSDADKAHILEQYVNSHQESTDNTNTSPTDKVTAAAETLVEKTAEGIKEAGETIGAAAAAGFEAAGNAADVAGDRVEQLYERAEALLSQPSFAERTVQFTKDHARDVVFGLIGFAVGVVATTVIKR